MMMMIHVINQVYVFTILTSCWPRDLILFIFFLLISSVLCLPVEPYTIIVVMGVVPVEFVMGTSI